MAGNGSNSIPVQAPQKQGHQCVPNGRTPSETSDLKHSLAIEIIAKAHIYQLTEHSGQTSWQKKQHSLQTEIGDAYVQATIEEKTSFSADTGRHRSSLFQAEWSGILDDWINLISQARDGEMSRDAMPEQRKLQLLIFSGLPKHQIHRLCRRRISTPVYRPPWPLPILISPQTIACLLRIPFQLEPAPDAKVS